jgi:hypothetical protein
MKCHADLAEPKGVTVVVLMKIYACLTDGSASMKNEAFLTFLREEYKSRAPVSEAYIVSLMDLLIESVLTPVFDDADMSVRFPLKDPAMPLDRFLFAIKQMAADKIKTVPGSTPGVLPALPALPPPKEPSQHPPGLGPTAPPSFVPSVTPVVSSLPPLGARGALGSMVLPLSPVSTLPPNPINNSAKTAGAWRDGAGHELIRKAATAELGKPKGFSGLPTRYEQQQQQQQQQQHGRDPKKLFEDREGITDFLALLRRNAMDIVSPKKTQVGHVLLPPS